MGYHYNVKTVRLDLGERFNFYGSATNLSVVVRSDLGDAETLTHEGTRTVLVHGGRLRAEPSTSVDVPTPAGDRWVTDGGDTLESWSYSVQITGTAPGRQPVTWQGTVAVPAAGTVVALDPGSGVFESVLSVGGKTGHVPGGGGNPVTVFDDFRQHDESTVTREGYHGELGATLTGQTWGVRASADVASHNIRVQDGVLRADKTAYVEARVGAPVTEMGADFVLDNAGGTLNTRGTLALITWLDLGSVNNKILARGGWGRTPCHMTLNHRYLRVDYMDVFPNAPGAVVNIGTWELPTQLVQDGKTVHRVILSIDYDAHTVTVNVSGNAPIVVEHPSIALMPDAEDYFCVEPYYSNPATDSQVGVVRAWAKSYEAGEVTLVSPSAPLLPPLPTPIVGSPASAPLPAATVSPDHWYMADRHLGADNSKTGSWPDAVASTHFAGFGTSAAWSVNRDPEGVYLTGTGVSTERFQATPTRNSEPVTVTALVRATQASNTDFINLAGYKLIKLANGTVRLQDGTGSAGTNVDGPNIGAGWALVTAVLNGASSELRVNSTSFGAGTLTGTATADSMMILNGGWNVPADFAEVQVFDRALTASEIDTVHAELTARSGLI